MKMMKAKQSMMNTNLVKTYIFVFFLMSDFIAFAQPTESEDDDLQDNDEPAVAINGKLFWLFLCGIIFAYYKYKNNVLIKDQTDL